MRIVTAGNLHYPRIRFHRASFQTLGESTGCAKGSEDVQRTPRDESSAVGALCTCTGKARTARFCRLTREISPRACVQLMATDEPQVRLRPDLSDLACRKALTTAEA